MRAILLLALIQALAAKEPLRSGCSPDDEQIATVASGDGIEVLGSVAGEGATCYKIAVIRQGQRLVGYVLGDALPAIAAFERQRRLFDEAAHDAEARALVTPPSSEDSNVAASSEPAKPKNDVYFGDFTERDINGNPVSLSGLNGRVTLVAFWSPHNPRSVNQMTSIMPLYNELHKSGLAAVGISTDPRKESMYEGLDDQNLSWPQIPDRGGMTERYQVNPKAGGILVLDSAHRIVASGPMGPEIENKVRQLLAAPQASR